MIFLDIVILLLATCHSSATEPQVIFAQIGNSVTLPRVNWGGKDKTHVRWYFDNIQLISRNPTNPSIKPENTEWQGRISLSSDFSLIISQVNASDFGIFRCEQYELVSSHEAKYKLYNVKMLRPKPLLINASLSLSCEIDEYGFDLVRPTVVWFGPENKPCSGKQMWNKNTLTLNGVTGKEGGKWTCEVNYGGKKLKATSDVTVVDLEPSLPDPIYTYDSFQNLNIPCSFYPKISWSMVTDVSLKGGSWSFSPLNVYEPSLTVLKLRLDPSPAWEIPTGTHRLLMERELKDPVLDVKIAKVSVKNRGNYTCNLEFGTGTIRRNVQVEVLQVISSPDKLYEGSPLNLTCTLGHPMSSDMEVNWLTPQESSLKESSFPHPVLFIPAVGLKERGRWTCQLKKNGTVLTSATFILKVEKASLNIWIITAIVGGALVLLFIVGIIVILFRRRRELLYRRRKRRYCCCKSPQVKGFYKT